MQEYVDITGKVYHHIYLVDEPTENMKDVGWYFSDECAQMHGPFSTLAETEKVLKDYCKYQLET